MHKHADALIRLHNMVIGWGTVGLAYALGSLAKGPGVVLPETLIDRLISFNPVGIWLYLSFFILVPYAYFTVDASRLHWLRRSMQTCAAVCGLVFVVWPTTLLYPDYFSKGDSTVSARLLQILLWGDSSQNCLPSLHAALTVLCTWALIDRHRPLRTSLAVLTCACICFSIIQLRRHLSIDVAAGLICGLACGWLCLQRLSGPAVCKESLT